MNYICPTFNPKTLQQVSLLKLLDIVTKSKINNEEDMEKAQEYLSCLPQNVGLELATYVEDRLESLISDRPRKDDCVHDKQWPVFLLWRAACTRPGYIDVHLKLRYVAYTHFSRYILQYLCQNDVQRIDSRSLFFQLGVKVRYEEPKGPMQYDDISQLLQAMLPKFKLLSEVSLGKDCGDTFLEIIGKMCKSLKKLSLPEDSDMTTDGFINFAEHQKNNCNLEEICIEQFSKISLAGLSKIWILPLHVKKLKCGLDNLYHQGEEIELECPNGPTKLTHLWINLGWNSHYANDHDACEESARHVLDHIDIIFPSLKSMKWEWLSRKWLANAAHKTWNNVHSIESAVCSQMSLSSLGKTYPQLESLNLEDITNDLEESIHFQCLKKFSYTCEDATPMTFATFRQVLSQAPNLKIVTVILEEEIVEEYTDAALCQLFQQCDHLKDLESLHLHCYNDSGSSVKLLLTSTSVNCILEKCPNIKLIGNLSSWSIDDEDREKIDLRQTHAFVDYYCDLSKLC